MIKWVLEPSAKTLQRVDFGWALNEEGFGRQRGWAFRLENLFQQRWKEPWLEIRRRRVSAHFLGEWGQVVFVPWTFISHL